MVAAGAVRQGWRQAASKTQNISSTVDSMILRSLKDHYVDISKMNPLFRLSSPSNSVSNLVSKVSPPSVFAVIKGAMDGDGPVLSRIFGNEEIRISVMRLANIVAGGGGEDDDNADVNQLFLNVEVSKPEQEKSLHFLCGLYPDALGIHGVTTRPKFDQFDFLDVSSSEYCGPVFGDLDEGMRDALHSDVEERGVNENLFRFLSSMARNIERFCIQKLGTFVSENNSTKDD